MTKEKPPKVRRNRVLWDAAMMTLVAYRKKRMNPLDAMQAVEKKGKPRRQRSARDNTHNAPEQGRDDH